MHPVYLVLVEAYVLVSTPQLHVVDVLLSPGPLLLLLCQALFVVCELVLVGRIENLHLSVVAV